MINMAAIYITRYWEVNADWLRCIEVRICRLRPTVRLNTRSFVDAAAAHVVPSTDYVRSRLAGVCVRVQSKRAAGDVEPTFMANVDWASCTTWPAYSEQGDTKCDDQHNTVAAITAIMYLLGSFYFLKIVTPPQVLPIWDML